MTDWASLDTPMGPRTGAAIPPLFEKLDAADARVRARALQDLHGRLVAVNGGYGRPFLDAALLAVPLLGARLASPGALAPQRGQLLVVLGDVAAGNHKLHLARGLPVNRLDRTDIGPARATQTAVSSFADPIRGCLSDDELDVRTGAAFALAWLPSEAERSIAALHAQLAREKNAVARATMLLALGYLRAPVDALRSLSKEKAPASQCAALAAMLVDPAAMDRDLDAALAPLPKPVVTGLRFHTGALARVRTMILGGATLARGDLEAHLSLVTRLAPELRPEADTWTIAIAVQGARAEPLDPEDLSPRAREVLRDHAARLATGRSPGLYRAFWEAGLFEYQGANERALGVTPAGPLDARVEGRPLWWWLHNVRAGRVDRERWTALLGANALAVLEDAASAPFELYRDRATPAGYDPEPLIAALLFASEKLGIGSAVLDTRIAELRDNASKAWNVTPPLFAPWP